jgi:starch-binding outer membrane protein, SusD/RagB family
MKKFLYSITCLAIIGVIGHSCKESFLERTPRGVLDETALANKKGVEALLIGAYSVLDGFIDGGGVFLGGWTSAGSNWVYGSVAGGEAHKGTDGGDQPDINPIERLEMTPTNFYFNDKWSVVYEGVARSNSVLRVMALAVANDPNAISSEDVTRITAETRFLRGHYHFEAKKMWGNVPYVDETVEDPKVPNNTDIWPQIEADLKFAVDNLPAEMDAKGRVNKWAALALYGKALLYQKKFAEAKTALEDVYLNGTNAQGQKYALLAKYHDNFNAATENSTESVFAVQYSIGDGAPDAANAGWGEVLNYPYGSGPGGCCGFFQPSQDFVNSFQVDASGLPKLDTYNDTELKNDQDLKGTDPFTPSTAELDARLDWSVGRRGIQYLDHGIHPGEPWIRLQSYGGPYSPVKNVFTKAEKDQLKDASFWTSGVTANNYTLIRFADVILMLAETQVETGNLEAARLLVNEVRQRAANPAGFVVTTGNPATYKVGLYTTPWTDPAVARKAVHFERKLELGLEGHRFFDLVRWDEAKATMDAYFAYVSGTSHPTIKNKRPYLASPSVPVFTVGKNEFFPVPQRQIDLASGTLSQNPGY